MDVAINLEDKPLTSNTGNQEDKEDDVGSNSHWDYAVMFGDLDPPTDKNGNRFADDSKKMIRFKENEKKRRQLVKRLKNPSVGLTVARKRASDGKAVFLLITASQERLEKEAELMELPMRVKEEYGSGYAPFEIHDKAMFEGADNEFGFFQPTQRHHLILSIIQGDPAYGGADINVAKLTKAGIITKMFPLHDTEANQKLVDTWAHWRNTFRYQPLLDIRNYYGEEVAFYFAWLGFYTTWLWAASGLGVIAFILYMIDKADGSTKYGIWVICAYSIFLAFWATLFLEYWKRHNAGLAYEWGMMGWEDVETTRPDFKGTDALGIYYKGHWVPLDANKDYGFPLPRKTKYYPSNWRNFKVGAVLPLLAIMVVSVVIGTFCVLSFRLFVQGYNSFGGALAGGVANAMTIIFMNVVWKMVATKLTEWENHRTQIDFDNALIFKIFVFYFVNSYTSFYYIAFFKSGFRFWESGNPHLLDACKVGTVPVHVLGCVDELTFQLATILGTNMIVGQAREVAIPWLLSKIQLARYQKSTGVNDTALPRWEKDAKLAGYQGTFDEYSEMVIQYGYITLFASAFPLAPLMAVLNNLVEIRTDAFKLLTSTVRPNYRGATGISNWYAVLEVLGVLAVITNCLLIGFSFEALARIVDYNNFKVLGAIVIMEHGILFIKYLIAMLVPDTPGRIVKQIAFQQFCREQIVKKVTGVVDKKFEDETAEDDLNNVDHIIEEKKNNLLGINLTE